MEQGENLLQNLLRISSLSLKIQPRHQNVRLRCNHTCAMTHEFFLIFRLITREASLFGTPLIARDPSPPLPRRNR